MKEKSCRAAVLVAPGQIRVESRPAPEISRGEVAVRVAYAGVCGTDIAIYSGEYVVPLPVVLGHEFTGYVSNVGEDAPPDLIGKLVTAEINNTCLSYGPR